jgi:hypothetical protein
LFHCVFLLCFFVAFGFVVGGGALWTCKEVFGGDFMCVSSGVVLAVGGFVALLAAGAWFGVALCAQSATVVQFFQAYDQSFLVVLLDLLDQFVAVDDVVLGAVVVQQTFVALPQPLLQQEVVGGGQGVVLVVLDGGGQRVDG